MGPELLLVALVATAPLRMKSSVDGGAADASWKYVRVNQRVELRAPPRTHVQALRWFELVPTTHAVNNTEPSFHFEPIAYERRELLECKDRDTCLVETSEPGVRSFQLELSFTNGKTQVSPGLEATELGGLGRTVHKIVVRRDDSYLGFLSELLGTPYIFGSSGNGRIFQPDLLIGSDCADLVVYGLRRLGLRTRYTSTFRLGDVATKLQTAEGSAKATGVKPGDILHFPRTRHVAVLYEDRSPKGTLDDGDLIIHTCWARATIEPMRATSCASWPINVHRAATKR